MSHRDDEHIVCEFLRKISPSREWEYLGEVEHHWISELCESIREHECAANAKLRELCIDMASHLREAERIHGDELLPDGYIARMRELGIEFK